MGIYEWSVMKSSRRMLDIQPFFAMEILARARELEQAGRDIVHMEIGEPDFPTPPLIVEAAARALKDAAIQYTPAAGLPALRQVIAGHYRIRHGLDLDPRRIFLTPGASGALLLALGLLVNPGDAVAMADPGYPCYPNFVRLFDGLPLRVAVDADNDFNLTAGLLDAQCHHPVAGVIVASPANPTGSILSPGALRALVDAVMARDGFVIADEIYHGLEYGAPAATALSCSDKVFVINSFSKYYGMTGWRLGWAVVPEWAIDAAERLAQNLFISAPTLSQLAALAAFEPQNLEELERRRQIFAERRDLLSAGLHRLGFRLPARPEGAFYVYADASPLTADSRALARDLLEEAGVAVTPGLDFGVNQPERYLRFCYTASAERLSEGLDRLKRFTLLA
jgi:aspartate/methionine/tyrosine aminotransferase